jgi:hypothetical protein
MPEHLSIGDGGVENDVPISKQDLQAFSAPANLALGVKPSSVHPFGPTASHRVNPSRYSNPPATALAGEVAEPVPFDENLQNRLHIR